MALKSNPHHLYVQKLFQEGFGPFLAPKNFLGCRTHPQTHFRPSENSVTGVFSRKNRYFCKFLAISVKPPNGFLQDTLQVLRAQGSRRSRKMPKTICTYRAHTRHIHFETSTYSVFQVHKKATFWRKIFLFVPFGCKYWFGVHPIVLAEKFGARRWFYIPWTIFNDQNLCLHNSLNLDTFQVF